MLSTISAKILKGEYFNFELLLPIEDVVPQNGLPVQAILWYIVFLFMWRGASWEPGGSYVSWDPSSKSNMGSWGNWTIAPVKHREKQDLDQLIVEPYIKQASLWPEEGYFVPRSLSNISPNCKLIQ